MRHKYVLTRWLFLRLLGIIFLIAFLSLWLQIKGLVGSQGILPAADFLPAVRANYGPASYHLLPTLFWFNASDAALQWLCGGGVLLSLLLIIGILPGPLLLILWLFYLSLVTIGRNFLGYQWDNLLLETGFLSAFFAPWQLWPPSGRRAPPSLVLLWLLRLLLFKLMFMSGMVKLLSGDPTWRNLTALTFHYETQPLPTWLAWYGQQMPLWWQQLSTTLMFIVELGVPFLIFASRRLRFVSAAVLVGFQLLIILTGNYGFFNWLTIVLCVLLLDDAFWRRWLPPRLVGYLAKEMGEDGWGSFGSLRPFPHTAFAAIMLILTGLTFFRTFTTVPALARPVLAWIAPFRSVNNYGLFAVMTTTRPEIIVEGSRDGESWQAYDFKWKPGDVSQRPRFVAPHQPRLDWQMWFAALGDMQSNPWLGNFLVRLLEGSPDVVALLGHNPFPGEPPRFVRATVYDYHFTTWGEADWWQRDRLGPYAPVLSLTAP